MLKTTYTNARRNFADLHQKVALERQMILLQGGGGDDVVWISLSDFLEQNQRAASADDILRELLA